MLLDVICSLFFNSMNLWGTLNINFLAFWTGYFQTKTMAVSSTCLSAQQSKALYCDQFCYRPTCVHVLLSGCGEQLTKTMLARECADCVKHQQDTTSALYGCFRHKFLGLFCSNFCCGNIVHCLLYCKCFSFVNDLRCQEWAIPPSATPLIHHNALI